MLSLFLCLCLTADVRRPQLKAEPTALASNGCDVCKSVINLVQNLLKSGKVETEIIAEVDKLCGKLPSVLSSVCEILADRYVPQIIKYIESGIEEAAICDKLGFCSANKLTARIPTRGTLSCTVCKDIVAEIERITSSTKVESEVIKQAQQACSNFPTPYNTLCNALATQFVPKVMEWLNQGVEHAEICRRLEVCSPVVNTKVLGARLPAQVQDNSPCDLCQEFFQFVLDETEKVSIDTLWWLVSDMCPKVPYLKYFCEIINEDNIVTLVNMIISLTNPFEICKVLAICPYAD